MARIGRLVFGIAVAPPPAFDVGRTRGGAVVRLPGREVRVADPAAPEDVRRVGSAMLDAGAYRPVRRSR